MYWQKHYIRKDEAITSGKVDLYPLPRINPISGLIIKWDFTTDVGGSVTCPARNLIEVVKNGHERIVSAQVGELLALDHLIQPVAYAIAALGASATGVFLLFIPFGRWLKDDSFYLDPTLFDDLALYVTQPTFATVTVSNITVILVRGLEWTGAPEGHFKTITQKQYTAAASTEYTDLPLDFPYALVMLSEVDGTLVSIEDVLSHARLNVDAGRIYPVDEDVDDLVPEKALVAGDNPNSAPGTVAAYNNAVYLNFLKPWLGTELLLPAPTYSSMKLEVLGLAAGTIRLTTMQLIG